MVRGKTKRKMLAGVMMALVFGAISFEGAFAVTYQTSANVSFTFEPKLTLSLSSSDLIISNLAPGAINDSNEITISVTTNTSYGYTLNATVGQSTTYNTRNLIRNDSNNANFSSIAYGSSMSELTTDATWGYSYKPSGNNTSWTTYSGLPLYSDTTNISTLISTTDAADSDSVDFKIRAKAASTQPAGEYRNVINFMAVSNPVPVTLRAAFASANKTTMDGYYQLQDMTSSICDSVETIDEQLQLIDKRDGKVYWVAKLRDGHCWMTQNLDLDLGVNTLTHNSTTLYHDDTDLGWGTDTATTSWTPINSTIVANSNGTFTGWTNSGTIPYSADTGNWYYAGYDGVTLLAASAVNYLTSANKVIEAGVTTIYNDANHTTAYFKSTPFIGTGTSNNGTHGHVGNYYNWSTAVASNDTSSYTSTTLTNPGSNPQNSICPAGWRLPTASMDSDMTEGSTNEYQRLNKLYNNGYAYTSAGLEAPSLFFVRSGRISDSGLASAGYSGWIWTSSVYDGSKAWNVSFNASNNGRSTIERYNAISVRCVAR